jgi:Family of unknown function (DUF5691)
MSLWTEIVSAAALGCGRKTFSLKAPPDELGRGLDQNDPEGALLRVAALVWRYERAEILPMKDDRPLPEACEPDDAPRCNRRAAAYLETLLRQELKVNAAERAGKEMEARLRDASSYIYPAKLAEWIEKAKEAGVRAPEELLPELLELGRKCLNLRVADAYVSDEILPALGALGRRLAAQNPRWAYAACELDETLWETKPIDQRSACFRALRKRDPARARELLELRWGNESTKDRASFLPAFEYGLSLGDEVFLERTLDDKGRNARVVAAKLLAHLPGSALCRRMFERARPLLEFKLDDQNRKTIGVRLPEVCDKAMRRDGVDPDPDDPRFNQKAWWLEQMLWLIPPKLWSQESGWTANELIGAAYRSEWKYVLIDGWLMAATRSRDEEWAYALLVDTIDNNRRGSCWYYGDRLLGVLPQVRQESLAIKELKAYLSSSPANLPNRFIYYCNWRWSEALSRLALDWLLHNLPSLSALIWSKFLEFHAPYRLNPALIPEAIARIAEATKPPAQRARHIEEFLNAIRARYDMLNAF